MKVHPTPLAGLFILENNLFSDSRGFFTERFREDRWPPGSPVPRFIQDNFSRSAPRVLRGLHYQTNPAQGKLVTCMRGKIFDVAVDLRRSSVTFGKHFSLVLDGNEPRWLWVPEGFAHGFCVLGDEPADVLYKVNNYYSPAGDRGMHWNDPRLKIPWPIENPLLSEKDERLPGFAAYLEGPIFS
ncbi:MAG: dTDP-4-dehydrorhamnose 3,5-epimerase [Bdellovibrio sp.]|nr:MAG: dTDP-4-dehydrorhamnose 3,5-epimerase [Bdellovibrio sp.]